VRLLGGFAVAATGNTSAAGLRQSLNSDALPVLFDEAESDNQKSSSNINDVLALMRHASANLDAKVIKGGADGKASFSIVRSCFCLSAIRDPVHQAADQSRITMLSLKPATNESGDYNKSVTLPLADQVTHTEFAARFRSRVFNHLPELLESIQVFVAACKAEFADSRMADQIGSMLGGAWVALKDGVPTVEQAIGMVSSIQWTEQHDLLGESSDEMACLQAIMDAHIQVDGDEWRGSLRVGDLVQFVATDNAQVMPLAIRVGDARRTLGMYGIKVDKERQRVLISNSDAMLARKIMCHTSWPIGWGKLLARIKGAEKPEKTVKIGGASIRCTSVPL